MIEQIPLSISLKDVIRSLNEATILNIGDENYLIYTFTPSRKGINPISGEEIIIPDIKSPSFYNKYSITNIEELLKEKNLVILEVNLPKLDAYPAILTLSDGMPIGTISKNKIHAREINGQERPERTIDLIKSSKEFKNHINEEIKKSYVVTIQPCEKLEADEELIDIKLH